MTWVQPAEEDVFTDEYINENGGIAMVGTLFCVSKGVMGITESVYAELAARRAEQIADQIVCFWTIGGKLGVELLGKGSLERSALRGLARMSIAGPENQEEALALDMVLAITSGSLRTLKVQLADADWLHLLACPLLTTLHLSNIASWETFIDFYDNEEVCSGLHHLELTSRSEGAACTDRVMGRWPDELLSLRICDFLLSAKVMASIKSLVGLNQLVDLSLENAGLKGDTMGAVLPLPISSPLLSALRLGGNKIRDAGVSALQLATNNTLRVLDLSSTSLHNPALLSLATNCTLDHLLIERNRLHSFALGLDRNTALRRLSMSSVVTDEAARTALFSALGAQLAFNRTLEVLELSATRMRGPELEALQLVKNDGLKQLALDENSFTAEEVRAVRLELHRSLQWVNLKDCGLRQGTGSSLSTRRLTVLTE